MEHHQLNLGWPLPWVVALLKRNWSDKKYHAPTQREEEDEAVLKAGQSPPPLYYQNPRKEQD